MQDQLSDEQPTAYVDRNWAQSGRHKPKKAYQVGSMGLHVLLSLGLRDWLNSE